MDKKIVKTSQAPAPIGAYNQAVWGGDTLYISGQIGINPSSNKLVEGDIQGETRQIMENLKAILQAAELSFEQVVKCSIFLDDINNFQAVNKVYAGYFKEDTAPAREAVQAAQLPKGVRVEISAIAVR